MNPLRLKVTPEVGDAAREVLSKTTPRETLDEMSDWEVIQRVEALYTGAVKLGNELAPTLDLLLTAQGERLAVEAELFLAIDYCD